MLLTSCLTKSSSRKTKREKLRQALTKQLVGETVNAKGRGLIALAEFSPGEIVAPIDGVHTWGGEELMTAPADDLDDYVFVCNMGDERYRKTDPVKADVGWHLMNQSCSPNAILSSFVFASRRIEKGEEITTAYGWHSDRAAQTPCLCGAPHCYGTLGPRVKNLKTEAQEIRAWQEYIDAIIANKNVNATINLRSWFDNNTLRTVLGDTERAERFERLAARLPRPYDYELSRERMLSLSF